MQTPRCINWITQWTSDKRRSICTAEYFESSLSTIGKWTFNAIMTELPARVTNRCCNLCRSCCAPKLVNSREHFHAFRLDDIAVAS
jgi:hypothetical protein